MRSSCALLLLVAMGCGEDPTPVVSERPTPGHRRMIEALQTVLELTPDHNDWLGDGQARKLRAAVAGVRDDQVSQEQWWSLFQLGVAELWLGNEAEAVRLLARVRRLMPRMKLDPKWPNFVTFRLGVAYLRLGVTQNCCLMSMPNSCLLPILEAGVHGNKVGARGAIECFTNVLENSEPGADLNLGARWLLNIAHMYLGLYPDGVPPAYLIPPESFAAEEDFPVFENIAGRVGLDAFSLSGGVVADDLDNDGHLDLMITTWETSGQMRLYRSNGKGAFVDSTEAAGLTGLLGGLNMVQADYDNDGHVDVFVTRGAWMRANGRHPNSLLRNLGDGRFTDVTFEAGLGEVHYPTQTAAWADYDNDGDVDLYIGNENTAALAAPAQLFRNEGDGTFLDVATRAGVRNGHYAKGVTWGDYDGDRLPDLFVSNLQAPNRLYHNNGDGTFTDVAPALGMVGPHRSFPAWFWDFDNDGHLDLYVSAYAADIWHLAASHLGQPVKAELAKLWKGDGRGGFKDVAAACNLVRPNSPMGSNFGDLDNDGFLDFYLGTGFPSYDTVMPNVMYRNHGGTSFADVSSAGRFAHLQKGHAVVFADLDHDGDQDVFEQMGGALKGDGFFDVLYENPGFGAHWIAVRLVGVQSNRSAIGARIRVVVREGSRTRSIYKHVNSGGTFGANPLRQTIGLGKAEAIERLEVFWPRTGETQTVTGVPTDAFVRIVEGKPKFEVFSPKSYRLAAER